MTARGLWFGAACGAILCAAAGCSGKKASAPAAGPSLTDQYETALKESNPDLRVRLLLEVTERQLAARDSAGATRSLEKAATAAGEIKDPADRLTRLAELVPVQTRAMQRGAAQRTIQQAETLLNEVSGEKKLRAQLLVGNALWSVKRRTDAEDLLRIAEKGILALEATDGAAQIHRIELLALAGETQQGIGAEAERSRVFKLALAEAEKLEDGNVRGSAISAVAAAQQRLKLSEAADTFTLAQKTALRDPSQEKACYALLKIVDDQLDVGDLAAARATLDAIEEATKTIQAKDQAKVIMERVTDHRVRLHKK